MKCIVCGGESTEIFQKNILQKYPVKYYQCSNCKHLFTEEPHWLNEAYSSAITQLDLGLLDRNILFREFFQIIFHEMGFDGSNTFVDFAGGYGVFTRLMRDKGWDYFWQDDYCDNLYAKYFEAKKEKYTAVTAFEVFEHSWEPKKLLSRMFEYADIVFFSTVVQPNIPPKELFNWYYTEPLTGQHISFASEQSLQYLAKEFQATYFNHLSFHCFVRNQDSPRDPFLAFKRKGIAKLYHGFLRRMNHKPLVSKLASDHDEVKALLRSI